MLSCCVPVFHAISYTKFLFLFSAWHVDMYYSSRPESAGGIAIHVAIAVWFQVKSREQRVF